MNKTLGELWFNKPAEYDHNKAHSSPSSSDYSGNNSDPSKEFNQNMNTSPFHWDPLQDITSSKRSDTGLLHRKIPQVSVHLPSLCHSIRSGQYTSDTISIVSARPKRDELILLSHALCNNKTIKTLRITHSHLWSTDARVLTYFLTMNNTIRTLDLSHNVITASGARAIAENLVVSLHCFIALFHFLLQCKNTDTFFFIHVYYITG
jgi:hypothetical protein